MRKLARFLKNYRLQVILGPIFKLTEAVFELIVPIVTADIIDNGVRTGDVGYVWRMGGVMLLLGVVGLCCALVCQKMASIASQGFGTVLRNEMYRHINTFSHKEIDRFGTPSLITRITNDVNQLQYAVAMLIRLVIRAPFLALGAVVMAMLIDLPLAIVFLVATPLIGLVLYLVMSQSVPYFKVMQKKLDRISLISREGLSGARVIRAFCKEEAQYQEFEQKNRTLTTRQRRAGWISGLMNPITYLLVNFAIAWLIYTGALEVSVGVLKPGEVVALYNYMGQILVELIKLANLIVTMNKGLASWKRITDVLNIKPDMDSPEKPVPAIVNDEAVRFDHVSLQYNNAGAESLTDIDFTALRGQTIGVIGGTGSGKSSVVGLIPRFYDATSGAVYVDGVDVRDQDEATLRSKIGFVMQKAVLFHGTIRDNLRWGKPDATDAELNEAIAAAQADDVVKAKGGLDAMIEQNGRNLSGGQRQRLTIARALVRKPEILVLDDSASALDQATDLNLRLAIRRLDYHPTVFIVSQRTASILAADQILVLDDGKAVGMGTHEALLESCPVYREIYESQYGGEAKA